MLIQMWSRSKVHLILTEICKLYNWLIVKKLSLNIKKSNFVIIRPRQNILKHEITLRVFDRQTNSYISLKRQNYLQY